MQISNKNSAVFACFRENMFIFSWYSFYCKKILIFTKIGCRIKKEDYFVNSEQINKRRNTMVVLDVRLDNFYAFKNFHMNLTYPKKIVGSCINEEHLANRPNFRYKKVNVIMGANATGKTTFGRMLMNIFNFIDTMNYEILTGAICEYSKEASFIIDMASIKNVFYRVACTITPQSGEKYSSDNIKLEVRQQKILTKDSYESCVKRIEERQYFPEENYIEELEKMEPLDWLFEYPEDIHRTLHLPDKDQNFRFVLESILRALDPSIQKVEISNDVNKAYVIRLKDKSIILQDEEQFNTRFLSSGTKAGVEVASVVSSLMQKNYTFYYCDEKFPYIHSDIEKAILSLMIEYLRPNDQLFFTTHNTDILDLPLPKHSFTFLRKNVRDTQCPITSIDASSLLKRSTDSLKNAVENDLFSSAPAVDLIYAIADA